MLASKGDTIPIEPAKLETVQSLKFGSLNYNEFFFFNLFGDKLSNVRLFSHHFLFYFIFCTHIITKILSKSLLTIQFFYCAFTTIIIRHQRQLPIEDQIFKIKTQQFTIQNSN